MGTSHALITLNEDQIPQKNGCEFYQKHFTYTDDQFNHLLTEKEDSGKEIEYTYDSMTNQVSAIYIKDREIFNSGNSSFMTLKQPRLLK